MSGPKRGFILLSRGWRGNPALQDPSPFRFSDAWMWLVEMAAFAETKHNAYGQTITVKRGQYSTSQSRLAREWRWDRTKLRRWMDRLRSDGMVRIEEAGNQWLITLCNYDKHQLAEIRSDTVSRAQKPTRHQPNLQPDLDVENTQENAKPDHTSDQTLSQTATRQQPTKEIRERIKEEGRGKGDAGAREIELPDAHPPKAAPASRHVMLVPDNRPLMETPPMDFSTISTFRLEATAIGDVLVETVSNVSAGSKAIRLGPGDRIIANRWLLEGESVGVSAATVVELARSNFTAACQKLWDDGRSWDMPNTLKYFDRSMGRLIAAAGQKPRPIQLHAPLPIPGGAPRKAVPESTIDMMQAAMDRRNARKA